MACDAIEKSGALLYLPRNAKTLEYSGGSRDRGLVEALRLGRRLFRTFSEAARWVILVPQIGDWEVNLRVVMHLFHIHHFVV